MIFNSPGIICKKNRKNTSPAVHYVGRYPVEKFKFIYENFPHTSWQFIKFIRKKKKITPESLYNSVTKYFACKEILITISDYLLLEIIVRLLNDRISKHKNAGTR